MSAINFFSALSCSMVDCVRVYREKRQALSIQW